MRVLCLAIGLSLSALPAWADARMTLLMEALQVSEVVSILRAEGLAYGEALDADMLDGQGGAFWATQVRRIYDAQRMEEVLRRALDNGLDDDDVEAALSFFGSDAGARIIEMENEARRAMSDPEVEEAARTRYDTLKGGDDPLLALVSRYIEVNDLLGNNVSGALSSNFQFLKGLSDGGYYKRSEAQILEEVWSERDDITADSESWLNGFLLLAYSPLDLRDLEAYVTYAGTEQGRALNAALFLGFGELYRDISYALGRAIALSAKADEI
jgi:hypothetical protein